MPIYEFACPRCRVIYNFLFKRIVAERKPACPKCGFEDLKKQLSCFSISNGSDVQDLAEPEGSGSETEGSNEDFPMPKWDDPKVVRAMREMERQMPHLDENNPRHLAHLMRKMKELMPEGSTPSEMEQAIRRLEAGEDLEKVESDMGEIWEGRPEGLDESTGHGTGGYSRDSGLYEF